MTPLFLHIEPSGTRKSITFMAQPKVGTEDAEKLQKLQSYLASGEFGFANQKRFDLPKAKLLYLTLNNKEEVDIIFSAEFENISMVYCASGFAQFRRAQLPPIILAQTQLKVTHLQYGELYALTIKRNEIKPCVLVHICIPILKDHLENPDAVDEITKHLEQFRNILDDESVFTSTIHTQKSHQAIFSELSKMDPDLYLVQAYTDIILLETFRLVELSRSSEYGLNHWDPEIRAVYVMAEMIILGMDEPWTIKKFASNQHINPNKLKILFKNHIGMPASEFKISVRMQKAAQLLKETKLSIQEISAMVGYTNPAQFSTMFKRKLGYTPNQVRKT